MDTVSPRFVLPYEPRYTAHRVEQARRLRTREWLESKEREAEPKPAPQVQDEKR
jgi:hypothetical protein